MWLASKNTNFVLSKSLTDVTQRLILGGRLPTKLFYFTNSVSKIRRLGPTWTSNLPMECSNFFLSDLQRLAVGGAHCDSMEGLFDDLFRAQLLLETPSDLTQVFLKNTFLFNINPRMKT